MNTPQFPVSDSQMQDLPPEFQAMMQTVKTFCEQLIEENQQLRKRIEQLEKRNAQLEKRNAELEKRLGITPQNSSLPPSSQHPHARTASQKTKSKRKQGGQKGHPKSQRELIPIDQVDAVIPCIPDSCRRCGGSISGEDDSPIRHQVYELPQVKPNITEYQQHRLRCPKCGITTRGNLPQGVPEHSSGPRLTTFVSMLMAHYRQSKRRTSLFLRTIFSIPASPGWVCKLQDRTTKALRPDYDELVSQLPKQSHLGIDETPMKQGEKNTWLWAFVAESFTVFQIRPSRSGQILNDLLTDDFSGTVTCDRAKMYYRLGQLQWCWAHLKRDFQKMNESSDSQATEIGEKLLEQTGKLFQSIRRCRDGTVSSSGLSISVGRIRKKVEALLLRGMKLKDRKTSGTCQNLYWHRENLWRFGSDPQVPATNNHSERALRHPVICRKLSFGTQSESGNRFLETMWSILETCRQQNKNALEHITGLLAQSTN